nr:tyrosine-protein phosphatase [Streptomyces zagrosensis]
MPQVSPVTPERVEPSLTGVRNFRDVGGLPTLDGRRVRHGVLFRSGHLAHATADDVDYLTSLGLHTVFDFRNSADIAVEGPDVALPGVRNVNVPLTDPAEGVEFWSMVRNGGIEQLRAALADGQAAARMVTSYRTMITTRTTEHARVLTALADDNVPALMHCAAGKDRAGLSIAITLLAIGVTPEAIESDYLESGAAHRRYQVRRHSESAEAMSPEVLELINPLFDAHTSYLAAAFEAIEATWGDPERYLADGLGLAPEQRDRLRTRLLTD